MPTQTPATPIKKTGSKADHDSRLETTCLGIRPEPDRGIRDASEHGVGDLSGLRFIPRGWRVLCGLASPPPLEQRTQVNHSENEPMPFSNGLDIKTNPTGSGHHQNHILTQHFFFLLPSSKDKELNICVLVCEKKAEGLSPRSRPQSTHTQSTVSPSSPDAHLPSPSPKSMPVVTVLTYSSVQGPH